MLKNCAIVTMCIFAPFTFAARHALATPTYDKIKGAADFAYDGIFGAPNPGNETSYMAYTIDASLGGVALGSEYILVVTTPSYDTSLVGSMPYSQQADLDGWFGGNVYRDTDGSSTPEIDGILPGEQANIFAYNDLTETLYIAAQTFTYTDGSSIDVGSLTFSTVPEPSSMSVITVGLGALLARKRRKRF